MMYLLYCYYALWTVEHQRLSGVGGKIRQLIYVVVIGC